MIPGRESGFAATAPMDFAAIPDEIARKIADKIAHEIAHWGKQNGSHFRLLSRKSTKKDVFSSVGGHRIRAVNSRNQFGQMLGWDRKSRCV